MRLLSILLLLPALSCAFCPTKSLSTTCRLLPHQQPHFNKLTDVVEDVNDNVEKTLKNADDTILKRGMRFVDHVPVLATLFYFGKQTTTAGGGSFKMGIDAAPSTFAASVKSPSLLQLPPWLFYVWPLISIFEILSVAKSVLNEHESELSQSEISALSVSNLLASQAVTGNKPLLYLAILSVVSAIPLRNSYYGDCNVHNAALQLMSSFTSVLTILGCCAYLPTLIPILAKRGGAEATAMLALAAYYILASRNRNGMIKKAVNAGTIGGIVWGRLAAAAGTSTMAFSKTNPPSVSLIAAILVTIVSVKNCFKDGDTNGLIKKTTFPSSSKYNFVPAELE